MCPLFGIAITSGHRLSSSQYDRLTYKTLIPAKGRGIQRSHLDASSQAR
jgi:hypothetical protein